MAFKYKGITKFIPDNVLTDPPGGKDDQILTKKGNSVIWKDAPKMATISDEELNIIMKEADDKFGISQLELDLDHLNGESI